MAPQWIRSQVNHLLKTDADITGLNRPYFLFPAQQKAWQYIYPANEKPWVHGGTLCYTKAIWQNNPFPELNIAEDSGFLWSGKYKKIHPHNHVELYVAMLHNKNVSPKYTTDGRWAQKFILFELFVIAFHLSHLI